MIGCVLLGLVVVAAAQEAEDDPVVMAMVAARTLPVDTVVREEDLYAVEIPVRYLSPGAVLLPDELVGHRLDAPIFAYEIVHERWVGPKVDGAPHDAVPDGWVLLPLGAPVIEVGARYDVVPERTECALLRDVVSAWDAPAAVAVRPEQVGPALLLGDVPVRLMPVDSDRKPCDP